MVSVTCKVCGKKSYVSEKRFKTGRGKYCSHKCRLIGLHQSVSGEKNWHWIGGKITKQCLYCGNNFLVYKSREKSNRGKFCSTKCKQNFGHTEESCKKMSIHNMGRPAWNKGKDCPQLQKPRVEKIIDKDGYVLVYFPTHPNCRGKRGVRILEHRVNYENHIGRYLTPQEVVHHINKIKTDNRIENLMLFPNKRAHTNYHKMLKETSS